MPSSCRWNRVWPASKRPRIEVVRGKFERLSGLRIRFSTANAHEPCGYSAFHTRGVHNLVRILSLRTRRFGRQLLRKRTIASGGSQPSVGKSLRERQRSPQVGRDPETCGYDRQAATEVISPGVSRVSGAVVAGRIVSACEIQPRRNGPHYTQVKSDRIHQLPSKQRYEEDFFRPVVVLRCDPVLRIKRRRGGPE